METVKSGLISKNEKKQDIVKKDKPKTIYDVIQSMKGQFEVALPKHVNSDRFVRIALTSIRQNPKLAKCEQASLLGALMTSAQLGLEPGILGQAYLIPYGNQVQFQIGYKGLIELLRRSGQLSDIYAYPVYENDKFEITFGIERNVVHIPNFKDRGKEIGYYAVAKLKDGAVSFEYMTKEEIEKHRDKFSKAANSSSSPWKTDFNEMAKKTVIKKLLKYLPVSIEFLESASKDEKTYEIKKENIEKSNIGNEILDPMEIEEVEIIDETTGEIIEEGVNE
ncbi:recombination protein RecT [Streptobacillus moniliformis]|uniref:recombination protein RecT n=1 Tax=Streptobacillus moniliformis TaxID=34105 RepID=UPI0007E3684D|nr:recombination protein RecT [Streptobacillus moniliformis]